MDINYQPILDLITQLMYVLAPIVIIFVLVEISTNYFVSLVRGDRKVRL